MDSHTHSRTTFSLKDECTTIKMYAMSIKRTEGAIMKEEIYYMFILLFFLLFLFRNLKMAVSSATVDNFTSAIFIILILMLLVYLAYIRLYRFKDLLLAVFHIFDANRAPFKNVFLSFSLLCPNSYRHIDHILNDRDNENIEFF